ncbi:MAG TPA: rod shape-determining protein MreD [Acidimicrobiales bacterium]|jgi:rod shape-determining protein MreD
MRAVRLASVIFVLVTLQTTLMADLAIRGTCADIVMLLPIAVGIVHGREEGAIAGFASGLVLDLVVHGTPAGFFALGYTLTGYIVGITHGTVLRAAWWIPVLTAVGGSVVGVTTLGVLAKMVGLEGYLNNHLIVVALVVAVVNGALVLPMLRVVRWALPTATGSGRLVLS